MAFFIGEKRESTSRKPPTMTCKKHKITGGSRTN